MPTSARVMSPKFEVSQLEHWLPVDAVIERGRPGLHWLKMSGIGLVEPFFGETVARVRNEKPEPVPVFTDFDVLFQLEKVMDGLQPAGFIFHLSRCGSTLVANTCRVLRDSLVVAEPPA